MKHHPTIALIIEFLNYLDLLIELTLLPLLFPGFDGVHLNSGDFLVSMSLLSLNDIFMLVKVLTIGDDDDCRGPNLNPITCNWILILRLGSGCG